jgi:hypothetical protein
MPPKVTMLDRRSTEEICGLAFELPFWSFTQ